MTPLMPTMTAQEFIARWRDAGFGERQGAQSLFWGGVVILSLGLARLGIINLDYANWTMADQCRRRDKVEEPFTLDGKNPRRAF